MSIKDLPKVMQPIWAQAVHKMQKKKNIGASFPLYKLNVYKLRLNILLEPTEK